MMKPRICAALLFFLYVVDTVVGDKCFDGIGCLSTGREWDPLNDGAYHPYPKRDHARNIKLQLFVPGQRSSNPVLPNRQSLDQNGFDKSKKVKVLIGSHKMDNEATQLMNDIANSLQTVTDSNVFLIQWPVNNREWAYHVGRLVGLFASNLVRTLKNDFGVPAENIHLIGFHNGAQVASYVGEAVKPIGRITALNPDSRGYKGKNPSHRLDPLDAALVDVIHTTGERDSVPGYDGPLGHLDFFPNAGRNQPGCKSRRDNECHGNMALKYFLESIRGTPGCSFVGVMCGGFQAYSEGKCISCDADGRRCALMGLGADRYPLQRGDNNRMFYLHTSSGSGNQFCQPSKYLQNNPYETSVTTTAAPPPPPPPPPPPANQALPPTHYIHIELDPYAPSVQGVLSIQPYGNKGVLYSLSLQNHLFTSMESPYVGLNIPDGETVSAILLNFVSSDARQTLRIHRLRLDAINGSPIELCARSEAEKNIGYSNVAFVQCSVPNLPR